MKLTAFSILILVLVIGAEGCSSSTGPANTVSWTIPNPGSYFITAGIDSLFPTTTFDTSWVTGGAVITGRGNTITLGWASFYYQYISYELNGDISLYPGGLDSDSGWSQFPTGGGTSYDSAKTINVREHYYQIEKRYRFYNGNGTMNIDGKELSTIKIHEVDSNFSFDSNGNLLSQDGSATSDYNFIPSIGFLGSHINPGFEVDALVSYELN